jgi:hypothetical protein
VALVAVIGATIVLQVGPRSSQTAAQATGPDVVQRLYRAVLDRDASSSEHTAHLVDYLSCRVNEPQLAARLVRAPEFGARPSIAPEELVTRVYRTLLDRAPDPAGGANWVGWLQTGVIGPATLMTSIAGSAEFRDVVAAQAPDCSRGVVGSSVERLYGAFFLRGSDPAGAAYWTERIRSGRLDLAGVAELFASSSEFKQRYGVLGDRTFVELVYCNVLGRAPDAGGLGHWTGALRHGATRGQVMTGFSESAEFILRRGKAGAVPAACGSFRSEPGAPSSDATPSRGILANIPSAFDVGSWITGPASSGSTGYPAFRFNCSFSHLAYADPIVAPGVDRFPHLHMFFGNTGADHRSTYDSLRRTGSGTCDGGPVNRTAYWMPAVFDGRGDVVVPSSFHVYYKAENAWKDAAGRPIVQQFPNGLRMIAGARMDGRAIDPNAPSPSGAGHIWGWTCDGSRWFDTRLSSATIPDCGVGGELTAFVRFPYCWNGTDLDSSDHRSHVVYGTSGTWGPCPSSHPIHLPEITEFAVFRGLPAGHRDWHLSSDRMAETRPNGSTFHADWYGAWDNAVADRWLENCLRGQRSVSNGHLCDGTRLIRPAPYSGPSRLSGYSPMPSTHQH